MRKELISENEKECFNKHYQVCDGNADYYVYFLRKSIYILKDNGYFGLICSNKFTRARYGEKLSEHILNYKL